MPSHPPALARWLFAFLMTGCQAGGADPGRSSGAGSGGKASGSGAGGGSTGVTATGGSGGSGATGGTASTQGGSVGTVGSGGMTAQAGGSGGSGTGTGGNVATGGAPGSGGSADAGGGGETDSTVPDAASTPGARTSAACGKGMPAPAAGYHTIKVGARDRRFFLRVPPVHDGKTAVPVIFGFHGAGNKDGNWFDTHTGLRRETEAHAVLVFGESLYRPGSTTERSWQDEGQLPDNLAYIDATLAWVKSNLCVDPARIFAAGQSSGAYFSQTLGCHRGDVFRAVASSDGGERLFSNCKGHPGAFVRFRPGSAGGGADSLRVIDFWRKHNSCGPTTTPTNTPPCAAYTCQHDAHLWRCPDGGEHDWPAYMDKGVWTFFSQFK